MFSFRGIRHSGRSYSTTILLFTTITTSLLTLHLYRKDKQRQNTIQYIPSSVIEQPSSITKIIEKTIRTGILIYNNLNKMNYYVFIS
jgi:hypothetical protein